MGSMMHNPVYGILEVLEKRKRINAKGGKDSFPAGSPYPHATKIKDLIASIASWPVRVHDLAGVQNWNIDRVLTIDGIRKPKAHLSVGLTDKGNLILEWYPDWPPADNYQMSDTDFRSWSRSSPRPPMNRIITVRDMWTMIGPQRKPLTEPGRLFLQVLSRHLESVIGEIGHFVNARVESSLYLTYEDGEEGVDKEGIRRRAEVQQADILATEEIICRKNLKWLHTTFDALKISPETFLTIFKEADYRYYRAAQVCKKNEIRISPDQTKKFAIRLYKDFNSLYNEYCSDPPQGVQAAGSNVISLQKK